MGLYWAVIAGGSIAGVPLAIAALAVFRFTFAGEFSWATVEDSVRWGTLVGLMTTGMVIVGTFLTARHLGSPWGKGLFILLSFLSPLAGWLLYGAANGVLVGWDFFFGYCLIAVVASVTSTLIAAVAAFFMPEAMDSGSRASHSSGELGLFRDD